MRFTIHSFITLVTAAVAAAQLSINPDPSTLHPKSGANSALGASAEPQTNAKRFAMNLPPLQPKAHRRRPHRNPRTGTKVVSAPRAVTSPSPPVTSGCNILAKTSGANSTTIGYLSPVFNGFGEYGTFQPSQDGALEVSFSYAPDMSAAYYTQLDFLTTNSPSAQFPYVGFAAGFASTSDDIGPGSYNYGYVTGTTQTPKGSPPEAADNNSFGATTGIPVSAESAVWVYNPLTQAITAQWINTDGSLPTTHLVYFQEDDAILYTGDAVAARNTFGFALPEITLTCVPLASSQPTK